MSVRNLGKKTLAFGLLICIVFSISLVALSSCETPEYKKYEGLGTYEGLDAKTELEIIKSLYGEYYKGQESINNWLSCFFYGVYNGYVFFNQKGRDFFDKSEEIIDGLIFIHPTSHKQVIVWKNGQVYQLQELYDMKLLARADLEMIHTRYKELHYYVYCEVSEGLTGLGRYDGLSPEIELEIIKWTYGENYEGQETIDKWQLPNYYGVYDGYVIYEDTSWSFGTARSYFIGDLEFRHGGKIIGWKDGQAYELQEIYDSGFLIKTNLEKIYLRCKEYHYGYYIVD